MASSHVFITLALIVIIFPCIATAKEFIVGDEAGWTTHFDYITWAANKVFQVGDKLVFKYPVGEHNVCKVNGTAFKDCINPPANQTLSSGNDVIELATPGRKWYIDGIGQNCEAGGQKLVINVVPHQTASPFSAPSPLASPSHKEWESNVVSETEAPSSAPSPSTSESHKKWVSQLPKKLLVRD